MEKKQSELCLEILRRFNKAGILKDLILIGSWCAYFYDEYFSDTPYLDRMAVKTRDIDFLIDKAAKDRNIAIEILRALINKGEFTVIKRVFNSIPEKWRKKIMKGLSKGEDKDILAILEKKQIT